MKLPVAIATVLLGSGCSSAVPTAPPAPDQAIAATTPRNSIGTIRTRDRALTLLASPAGVKVTVRSNEGKVVAAEVDVETLRSIDPDLYDIVRSGTATKPYLDATLDHRNAKSGESEHPTFDRR